MVKSLHSLVDKCINIDYYDIDGKPGYYITKESLDEIKEHMNKIIHIIKEVKDECKEYPLLYEYYDILLKMASQYLYNNSVISFDTNVMNSELITLKVGYRKTVSGVLGNDFRIYSHKKYDLLTHHDKRIEMLNKPKEPKNEEELKETEDETILEERRKLVLKFEHPSIGVYIDLCKPEGEGIINNGAFVDAYGNYQYDTICDHIRSIDSDISNLPCLIEEAARLYRLRCKSRQHFEAMNKIVYDYKDIKQRKLALHNELKVMYKIMKKYSSQAPIAIMVSDK